MTLSCSRCERTTNNPEEIAGSWFTVGGQVICPTCATLDDLSVVQDERGGITCLGCGTTREPGGDVWRGYRLTTAQALRCLLEPPPDEISFLCADCEPRILFAHELG
jgi:hypothetical protein